ncbi:MAG: L,D-transpeptidase [Burkholderiales bacterium]|nr:L,D-transpeptidase [Burkholderiales bacterium]
MFSIIERQLDFGRVVPSADARRLAGWIVGAADNGEHPFAIIDKAAARVYLFQPSGRLLAASPVLLGFARGDDSVAGIGLRPIAEVRPNERTTPAGRYVAHPGRNAQNDDVLWIDYDTAVSMHRVRLTEPSEQRLARLASPSPRDNRISYGCINLPGAFFDEHFWPLFGAGKSVVYILPETKPLAAVFPAAAAVAAGA